MNLDCIACVTLACIDAVINLKVMQSNGINSISRESSWSLVAYFKIKWPNATCAFVDMNVYSV